MSMRRSAPGGRTSSRPWIPPIDVAAAQGRAAARSPHADDDVTRWNELIEEAVAALAGAEESVDAVVAWADAAREGYAAAVAQATGVKERFEALRDEAEERSTEMSTLPDEDELQAAVARVDQIIAWVEPWIEAAAADPRAIDDYAEKLVESTSGGDSSRFHDLRDAVGTVEAALRSAHAVADVLSRSGWALASKG